MPLVQSKKYPWVVVGLLWGVALLNYLDRQMLSTMRPVMLTDIKELESATYFGYLLSVFLWIYGLVSPFSGLIADRFSKKRIIILSLFVWSAVTFLMGYAQTFNQLFWLRAIMGFSEALYIPAGLALIASYHDSKTRSLAVGIHMTGLYMGQALGGFGSTIATSISWQQTFQFFGLIGIIYSLVLFFFLSDRSSGHKSSTVLPTTVSPFSGYRILFSSLSFIVLLFYFMIPSLPGWGIKNWLPTLFAQNLNIEMSVAGPLSTITIAISSLAGVITGGILSDKWAQVNFKGRVYTSAIGLALTIPALYLIGVGQSIEIAIGAALLYGFGFGMFDANNMPILCQLVPSHLRATGYGVMNMGGVFAGAFTTYYLGKSFDAGHINRDIIFLSLIVAAAIALQLLFLHPKPQDQLDA